MNINNYIDYITRCLAEIVGCICRQACQDTTPSRNHHIQTRPNQLRAQCSVVHSSDMPGQPLHPFQRFPKPHCCPKMNLIMTTKRLCRSSCICLSASNEHRRWKAVVACTKVRTLMRVARDSRSGTRCSLVMRILAGLLCHASSPLSASTADRHNILPFQSHYCWYYTSLPCYHITGTVWHLLPKKAKCVCIHAAGKGCQNCTPGWPHQIKARLTRPWAWCSVLLPPLSSRGQGSPIQGKSVSCGARTLICRDGWRGG